MPALTNPVRSTADAAAGTRADPRAAVGARVVSRFGDISPAFAAAFGASVSVGFALGARNAEARARSQGARFGRGTRAGAPALPRQIATAQALPPSRIGTTVVLDPSD